MSVPAVYMLMFLMCTNGSNCNFSMSHVHEYQTLNECNIERVKLKAHNFDTVCVAYKNSRQSE